MENTRDPEQFRQASDLLSQVGYSDAPSKLIQKLHGEQNPQGYQAIIRSLGLFDTDEAVSALTNLIKSPDSSIRKQAAKTLIEHKRTNATNDLIIHLNNSDWNIRWCAAVVLGNFANHDAIPMLLEGLSYKDNRGIRITAAQLLGMFENDKVIYELRSSLKDPDYSVRRSAAISLANFNQQEAIPELLKALRHYYPSDDSSESVEIPSPWQEDRIVSIRGMTHEILNQLGDNEAIKAWLWERNSRKVKVREQVADALGRFNTEEVITGLFSSLDKGVKAAAVPLGKLGKQEVVSELIDLLQDPSQISSNNKVIDTLVSLASLGNLEMVSQLISILKNINEYSHTDFYFKNRVAIVLGIIEHQAMASYLPDLVKLLPTEVGEQVSWAIDAIQFRYGFYNYELPVPKTPEKVENLIYNQINSISQELKKVTEQPQRVIHTENYFEKGKHTHTHNYANKETLKQKIPELRQLVHQLQQTHQPTTEVQAAEIIDVEFREIKKTNPTRWQTIRKQLQLLKRQLLNPESHLEATKATLAEVAKHYLEESVVSKAIITYLDTMSAETEQGE